MKKNICSTIAICVVLFSPAALAADEEKMVAPAPPPGEAAPAVPGGADVIVTPTTPAAPDGGAIIIMPQTAPEAQIPAPQPEAPGQAPEAHPVPGVVVEPPVIVRPAPEAIKEPQKPEAEKPAVIVPVVPVVPAAPAVPAVPEKPVIAPVVPPAQEKPVEQPKPEKDPSPLSPAQFLPQTEIKPVPEQPKKKPEPPRKPEPPKKAEAPKEKPQPPKEQPKKAGEELRIPQDAAKSGKKDFLEGCWRGKADGKYGDGKQASGGMTFCFDKNGRGRREWLDERRGETCRGAASARVDSSGTLHIISGDARCPSGDVWKTKEIVCRDNGQAMECHYLQGRMSVGPFVRK